ncbi:MAG: sigma-70 family RNA polymerase sigma factor [Planctomycetes bacterium]|nr:sigma-70 family RNA polymerase sigma factor [Planctomycetota bacterium]
MDQPDDHTSENSSELAQRAAAGDRAAVDALIERHLPELRAFVRLRAGDALRRRESTSDLVQSTCREVLTHLERFQFPDESAFRRWLFVTAQRKIADRADHYAAQKRAAAREERLASEAGVQDEQLANCYRRFSSPSRRALLRDEVEQLERAFDALTEEQREIVTLAHVVGLSRAQIAEQVGKSENAVRIVLHRALARLAEIVNADE